MNITIVGFLDQYSEYFRGDYDGGHDVAFRIDHPETEEAAAAIVAELLIEGEQPKHGPWDITILFNGRAASTEEEEAIEYHIMEPATTAYEAARAKRLEDERREKERRETQRRADEQAARERREKQERDQLTALIQKYGLPR